MRRWICLLIAVLMLLLCFGCTKGKTEYKQPVSVYYCRSKIAYNTIDGVLAPETRDFDGFEHDLRGFLNQYLKGPHSENLSSPFPNGGWILMLDQQGTQMFVRLSMHFSQLTGKEQTLSCACISKTLLELTDCESICLQIDGAHGNEDVTITMTEQMLLLMDTTLTN